MKKIKLFCFSYAGGSSIFYHQWANDFDERIQIIPVEIPGHGIRMEEDLLDTIDDIAELIFEELKSEWEENSYAFFGHSMGTIIITELMYKILEYHYPKPLHIFMSGRFSPDRQEKQKIAYLPDEQLCRELVSLGGTPEELLEDKEMLEFFLPVIRKDYQCVESYQFSHPKGIWQNNMSIFYGDEDKEVEEIGYDGWTEFTSGSCDFYKFPGGHFFIHSDRQNVMKKVESILLHKI